MVSPVLVGRMGNQMFQIAACIAYAKKHKLNYHIPAHTANDSVWKPLFTNLENPLFDKTLPAIRLEEKRHNYSKIDFEDKWKELNIFLSGYWQSYLYFDWCLDHVRKIFFGNNLKTQMGVTSIHVRRGDYLLYPDKHPVVTEHYLIQAIMNFSLIGYKNFIFFSDDIGWCKSFITDNWIGVNAHKNNLKFNFAEGYNEQEDFQLMAQCENNIVANSSFSVLAAIFNPNPTKIVICPDEKNYFGEGNKHLDVSTLMPPDWLRINF